MSDVIRVSPLGKTWIFDLDGTIVKHNGYKIDGQDSLLPGAKEFFEKISTQDKIIFITSRPDALAEATEKFLEENRIPFHQIIYNAPYGERILVNDCKPSGLQTAIAVNTDRNQFMTMDFEVDERL